METEIDVENKDLSLTPGEYANTTIELERHDNVLTIPVQAVIRNGNQQSVLVVDASHHVQTRNIVDGPARFEPDRGEVRACRGRPRDHRESIELSAGRNRDDQSPAEYRLDDISEEQSGGTK